METLSKTPFADDTQEKVPCHPAALSGLVSESLSSYKEYPAHRPFINTLMHHTPKTYANRSYRSSSPSKGFPETSSAEILSSLRNLQEKIRRLELERGHREHRLQTMRNDASLTYLQSAQVTQRQNDQTGREREIRGHSNCNQALITHLAAAESRCVKLEQQLNQMRRMLQDAKAERTGLLQQQVLMETAKSAGKQSDAVSHGAQLLKLEQLEQEYRRLTRTQNRAEMKICQLEVKLEEEERQRKLVQDKANQLQTGLETNRILLQSVSPHLTSRQSKEKKSSTKRSSPQQSSYPEPHYRLSLRDVPFVTGTSVSCSHSVRANVQSVLSLLKQHQPQLCNSHVLSDKGETGSRGHSDTSSSSSSSAIGEELTELLQALKEELRLMSVEQDELMRQLEAGVSEAERKEIQKEQEGLLRKMERKGEQISKLYKHKTQIRKLRKEADCRTKIGNSERVRGRSAGAAKARPGERSKRNLGLLRDMRALQNSLRT